MDIERAIVDLAYAIRRAVRPHLGKASSKNVTGKASSGDESFAIDEVAEKAVAEFIAHHNLPVAYYTEERGLVECACPEHLLVIDPIDGTRPAMVGLEGSVVSIALAPYSKEACLSDVTFGCVLELKEDRLLTAVRGGNVRILEGETYQPVSLTLTSDLDKMSWSFDIAGRPMELVAQVIGPMVNRSSLRGGVYIINSIAFCLTRLVTGQFDAVVDVSNRILRDHPELRQQFVESGLGTVIGLFPYDIAAAVLIAETAGCHVTDAYGNSLGDTPLLDTSEQSIRSCVAASNPVLHERLLAEIERNCLSVMSDTREEKRGV